MISQMHRLQLSLLLFNSIRSDAARIDAQVVVDSLEPEFGQSADRAVSVGDDRLIISALNVSTSRGLPSTSLNQLGATNSSEAFLQTQLDGRLHSSNGSDISLQHDVVGQPSRAQDYADEAVMHRSMTAENGIAKRGRLGFSAFANMLIHLKDPELLGAIIFFGVVLLTTFFVSCVTLRAYFAADKFSFAPSSDAEPDAQSDGEESSLSSACSGDMEWCPKAALTEFIDGCKHLDVDIIEPPLTAENLAEVLISYGIDERKWSQHTLSKLKDELSDGAAKLWREDSTLLLSVDYVVILLVYAPSKRVMLESGERSHCHDSSCHPFDGAIRCKLQSTEGLLTTAYRCLQDQLQIDVEGKIIISPNVLDVVEKKEVTENFIPDMLRMTRFFVLEASVIASDCYDLQDLGIPAKTLKLPGCRYQWEKISDLPYVQNCLRQRHKGVLWPDLGFSLVPVLPWTEASVRQVLCETDVEDPRPFGMTVDELTRSLRKGSVLLCKHKASNLALLTEWVSLVIESQRGQIMITEATRSTSAKKLALPTTQKCSHESIWNAAFRVSRTSLNVGTIISEKVLAVTDRLESNEHGDFIVREFVVRGPNTSASW